MRRLVKSLLPAALLPAVLAALVLLPLLTLPSCKKPPPPAPPPPIVQVMTVTQSSVPLTGEFIGELDSPRNIEVRARVGAFVEKILFIEGVEVQEGAPLFALDKKPFLEKLAAAQGAVGEAQAALAKYEKDVARLTPLAAKRAIPQQDLDNALASVDVGKASVVSAEARLESAKLDLGYCDVFAQGAGLIGAAQVAVGDLVGVGAPTLLATISTLDPIWFYCSVSEVDYLAAMRVLAETGRNIKDLPVTLLLADGSEHSAQGKWVFLDRAVDPTTGTLRARAEFPNPGKVLRPGMFARARVRLKTQQAQILVPQRAVLELQQKNFVWVVGADKLASQRSVRTGARYGSDWIIEEGLAAGDTIIVEGLQKAREGAAVQPMTAEEMAKAAEGAKAAAAPAVPSPAAQAPAPAGK